MAKTINSVVGPGPRTPHSFGNVPVPIVFGNNHDTLESGGVLVANKVSDDSAIAAVDGSIYLRAGTVIAKKTGEDVWKVVDALTDTTPADGLADQVVDAQAVGILKTTVDLANGAAPVGIFIGGGFFATRMPKVADNTAVGLEAAAVAALKTRGFYFAEDFH